MAWSTLALEVELKIAPVCSGGWPIPSQLCRNILCLVPAGACSRARDLPSGLSARLTHTASHAVLPAQAWDISTFPQGMRGRTALPCCAPSGRALLPAFILHNATRLPLSWKMALICAASHPSCSACNDTGQCHPPVSQVRQHDLVSAVHWVPPAVLPSVMRENGMCLQLRRSGRQPHAHPSSF